MDYQCPGQCVWRSLWLLTQTPSWQWLLQALVSASKFPFVSTRFALNNQSVPSTFWLDLYGNVRNGSSWILCWWIHTKMATSLGLTETSYFCLKHWMNRLSGLSVPRSMCLEIRVASNADSKLAVASWSSCLSLSISMSFDFSCADQSICSVRLWLTRIASFKMDEVGLCAPDDAVHSHWWSLPSRQHLKLQDNSSSVDVSEAKGVLCLGGVDSNDVWHSLSNLKATLLTIPAFGGGLVLGSCCLPLA